MSPQQPTRYSQTPFPPYRHLPGQTPHPTRDPQGHSFGHPEPDLPDLNEVDWRSCPAYLYGIDLFNAGYWWECHEIFEGLWHTAGHRSPMGHVLQGLILCAAAHLKAESDSLPAAARLFENSLGHFGTVDLTALGLNLEAVVRDTRSFITLRGARPARLRLEF